MTVTANESSKRFHGAGSAGPFTWLWRFLANTDVNVYRIANPNEEDPSTEVRELLTDGDDYLLTGAGSYTGGSLMLSAPLVNGEDLLIERRTAPLQTVSIRNQGSNFRPEVHEEIADRLTMMIQDRERDIDTNTSDVNGLKSRMATAENTLSLHGARLDVAEADIDSLDARATVVEDRATALEGRAAAVEGRATSLEERMMTTEVGEADREERVANVETTVAGLMDSLPPFLAHLQDATAGQVYVDVVAANNPAAKLVIVGKTDDSANAVTVRPAAGTVGGTAEWDIAEQGVVLMFVPNATTNNYLKIG